MVQLIIWWLCVKFYDQKPIKGWKSKINLTWFEKMNRFEIWIFDILITWLGLWSEINRLRDSSHVFCHIALFSKTCDIYWWHSRQQLTCLLFWKKSKGYVYISYRVIFKEWPKDCAYFKYLGSTLWAKMGGKISLYIGHFDIPWSQSIQMIF